MATTRAPLRALTRRERSGVTCRFRLWCSDDSHATSVRKAFRWAALLKDAVNRTASCAQEIGIRAMLVHAIDAQAASFYEFFSFKP
jgi:hypothetical protein